VTARQIGRDFLRSVHCEMLLLVGDIIDGRQLHGSWKWACEFTLRMNRHLNSLRARLGLPYWSPSRHLKLKVKNAASCLGDFGAPAAERPTCHWPGVPRFVEPTRPCATGRILADQAAAPDRSSR
jgi:UDP-2,3-diacylglucosamine pyrophosphatase LpxH